MKNVRRVLVALAFSEYAKGTFSFAADFAQCANAELIVANVINERDVESVRTISAMGYEVDGEHYIQNIKAERTRALEDIISDSDFPPERIRTVFVVGNPMEALLKLIVAEGVDVVVMGPKGRTDLEHVLVGSVAEKVFRRSPATLISYRDETISKRLHKRFHQN
ncbi:MAG: universal stress protein [Deltaproteobacteria bacterium]|jgi:nucleotide-binding universal stress UspA family protein|nr:universal stress protein [Deltaproteobacteria bacterium]